ncbi:AAA family ATPase [Pararhizobium sp. O133]|uniref:AAA family ATPase n=1 Tax=Pararhizobium sp. O133 TaxID=3449278 RepID=UPI003F689697
MTLLPAKLTVAHAAYGQTLKTAIRRGGVFLKSAADRQFVLVLKLPEGADEPVYLTAAKLLVKRYPQLERFRAYLPVAHRKRGLNTDAIDGGIEAGESVIVLWPLHTEVPSPLVAAADKIIDVALVRAVDLVSAVKLAHGQALTVKEADALLAYPLVQVFASIRIGRPYKKVLERLQAAVSTAPPTQEGPSLAELDGYGKARDWGLALADDISSWKRGAIAWSDIDKGILLSGPPGCGKTLFASALARTCGIDIVATSVSSWLAAGYLNDVLDAMRGSFAVAAKNSPCILFLDELDGIGDRSTLRGNHVQYWTQVVNCLLELVDGYDRLEGVVIVGATNFPEKIDAALRRAGRLDGHIEIQLPDVATRASLCRRYFSSDLTDVDIAEIVAATEGFSGADFEKIGRDIRRSARRNGCAITAPMVSEFLPPALKIEGARRRTVAVHEAGHAIVGLHLGVGTLKEVVVLDEIRGRRAHAGVTEFMPNEDVEVDRQMLLDQIAMLLGGRLAEEVILGSACKGSGGEGSDIHKATDIATWMDVQLGMGEGLVYYSGSSSAELEAVRRQVPIVRERVEQVLLRQWKRAKGIVERHANVIELLATQLEVMGCVDGRVVETMLRREETL